jgi:hypothetical protein
MLKFINEIDQSLVIYQEYGVPETTVLENGIVIPNGSLCVDKLNQEIYLLIDGSWTLVTDNTLLSNTTRQTINITTSDVTSYENLAFYQASVSKYYTSSYNGSDELSIILPDVIGNSGKWFVVEDSLGLTININKKTAEYGSLHKTLYAVGSVGKVTKTYFYCDGIKWRIAHSFYPVSISGNSGNLEIVDVNILNIDSNVFNLTTSYGIALKSGNPIYITVDEGPMHLTTENAPIIVDSPYYILYNSTDGDDELYGEGYPLMLPHKKYVNDKITERFKTPVSIESSATPSINTDFVDYFEITAQAEDITSFIITGTPVRGQKLCIDITGTDSRAISWGGSFEASTIALPTTTVNTDKLSVEFIWNVATSKWRIKSSY